MPTWYQGLERHIERHTDRIIGALLPPLLTIVRQQRIIMALVSVDDSVLASLTTLAQTVDSEVKSLIAAGTLQPGDVSGIQAALNDSNSALQAAASASSQPAPAPVGDGSTDTGTPPPADSGDGSSSTPPTDSGAPVDAGGDTSTDAPSA